MNDEKLICWLNIAIAIVALVSHSGGGSVH